MDPARDTLAELEESLTVLAVHLRGVRSRLWEQRDPVSSRVAGELGPALVALDSAQIRIRRAYQQAAQL